MVSLPNHERAAHPSTRSSVDPPLATSRPYAERTASLVTPSEARNDGVRGFPACLPGRQGTTLSVGETMGYLEIDKIPSLRRPILMAAFAGWNDAGQAATSALGFLGEP